MNFNNVRHVNCRLCESEEYEIIAEKVQFDFPYRTVACKNCGFIYINPEPLENELQDFYKYEYVKYYGVPVSSDSVRFKSRGYEIFEFIKEHVTKAERIIEIGAGGGGNLVSLAEKLTPKEIAAFEPGGDSNKSLKENNIHVLGDFYDTEDYNIEKYDLVIMSHVLEHFYKPKYVLEKLHRETSGDVNVYIAIPSLSAIDKEQYNYHSKFEDYWLRIVHLSYFHESNFEDMLACTGWKIREIHKKGNGELLALVQKNDNVNSVGNIRKIRNVLGLHAEEVNFYRSMC